MNALCKLQQARRASTVLNSSTERVCMYAVRLLYCGGYACTSPTAAVAGVVARNRLFRGDAVLHPPAAAHTRPGKLRARFFGGGHLDKTDSPADSSRREILKHGTFHLLTVQYSCILFPRRNITTILQIFGQIVLCLVFGGWGFQTKPNYDRLPTCTSKRDQPCCLIAPTRSNLGGGVLALLVIH